MRYGTLPGDNERANDFVNATGTFRLAHSYGNTTRFLRSGYPPKEHDKSFSRTLADTAPRYYQNPAPVKLRGDKLELAFTTRPHVRLHTITYRDVLDLTQPIQPDLATADRVESITRRYDSLYPKRQRGRSEADSAQSRRPRFSNLQGDIKSADTAIHTSTCVQHPVIPTKNPRVSYWTATGNPFEDYLLGK